MATSTRPSRKAAKAVNYAYGDPLSSDEERGGAAPASSDEGDDDDGETYGSKAKGRASKARKKRRAAAPDFDDDLLTSSDDWGRDDPTVLTPRQYTKSSSARDDEHEDVDYEIPRVDFSKRLPVETLCHIFSYLHAGTLYNLSVTSRRLRDILKSKTLQPVWRRAMRPDTGVPPSVTKTPDEYWAVPKVGGNDVDLIQLAGLLFNRECAFCGKLAGQRADRHLLRNLCIDCRVANLIPAGDVAKGANKKTYQDLHPATIQCVVATPLHPSDLRYERSQRRWLLPADLWRESEILEGLQMEDDEDRDDYAENSVDLKDVHRTLGRAKRMRRRWYGGGPQGAEAIEDALVEKYTPRVRQYLIENKAMKKDRLALAGWIRSIEPLYELQSVEIEEGRQHDTGQKAVRAEKVIGRVASAGVFKLGATQTRQLTSHPLVAKAEALTDDIWAAIEAPLYRFLGREIAKSVFARCGKKKAQGEWDDDDDEGLLKKPKTLNKTAWKYVRPELVKVAKEWQEQAKLYAAQPQEPAAAEPEVPHFSAEVTAAKDAFFQERYKKCFSMAPTKEAGWTAPRYGEFHLLPTVLELFADPKFAASTSDEARAADLKTWGEEHLDKVLDDMDNFAVDSRCEALRTILAATTDMGEEEGGLDAVDFIEAIASDEYNDEFFRRAGSYVSCRECTVFGPLQQVLKHVHKIHPLTSLYSYGLGRDAASLDELEPRVDLLLEVACAWSALLELAELDADKPVSDKMLDKAFKDKKLVWENGPRGTKRRGGWKDVIFRVTTAARRAHAAGDVLDVPVIALKRLTRRERGIWGGGRWDRYGRW